MTTAAARGQQRTLLITAMHSNVVLSIRACCIVSLLAVPLALRVMVLLLLAWQQLACDTAIATATTTT